MIQEQDGCATTRAGNDYGGFDGAFTRRRGGTKQPGETRSASAKRESGILPAYNGEIAPPEGLRSLFVTSPTGGKVVVDDGWTAATALVTSRNPCRLLVLENNCAKAMACEQAGAS